MRYYPRVGAIDPDDGIEYIVKTLFMPFGGGVANPDSIPDAVGLRATAPTARLLRLQNRRRTVFTEA